MSKMSNKDIEERNELGKFTEYRRGHREMILNAPSIDSLDRMVAMLVPQMGVKYLRRCANAEKRARIRLNNKQ
jgi:hypothetical protein